MQLDARSEFRAAIQGAGLQPPEMIEADGRLRRFSSSGKRGDDAGWYVFHDDGIPAGAYGDWRSGVYQTWRANVGRQLTPAEESAHRSRVEAMRLAREAEAATQHAEAAARAAKIWAKAKPAPADHRYLSTKCVEAY